MTNSISRSQWSLHIPKFSQIRLAIEDEIGNESVNEWMKNERKNKCIEFLWLFVHYINWSKLHSQHGKVQAICTWLQFILSMSSEESVPSENYRLFQGEVIMLVLTLLGEVLSAIYRKQGLKRVWGRLQANHELRLLQWLLCHH